MSNKEENNVNKQQANPTIVPQPYPVFVYPEEKEIELREIWNLLYDNRKLIGKITGACAIISLIVAFSMSPIYRAETLVVPVEKDKASGLAALAGQFGGLAELAGISFGGGSDVEESIATLESRELTAAFIKEEGMLPTLFPHRWDSNKKKWKKRWWDLSNEDPKPTEWEAYEIFDEDIRSVSEDKKTGLVTLSIEWKDPKLASKWANKLIQRVNEERRQEDIKDADKNIKYLEEQLQKTGVVEVQQSIFKLIEAQTKTKMIANTREEYAFKVIDPAVIPEKKSKPKRVLIVILGTVLGGIIATLWIFGRHVLGINAKKDKANRSSQ